MNRKLATLLAIAALAPAGIAACGEDEEEPAATTTTEAEETTGGADSGGGGETLTFTADPGGALEFEEDSVEASAGSVTLELVNESSTPHDVRVEGDGGDLGGTETITEGTASATVELEPGDYTFYCSVPGHREAGMEGDLTVE